MWTKCNKGFRQFVFATIFISYHKLHPAEKSLTIKNVIKKKPG